MNGHAERTTAEEEYISADQTAKLLSFCTKPAIYAPLRNWLCEFMSTVLFVRPRRPMLFPPSFMLSPPQALKFYLYVHFCLPHEALDRCPHPAHIAWYNDAKGTEL
jgi:hypothetical protein